MTYIRMKIYFSLFLFIPISSLSPSLISYIYKYTIREDKREKKEKNFFFSPNIKLLLNLPESEFVFFFFFYKVTRPKSYNKRIHFLAISNSYLLSVQSSNKK